MLKPGPLSYFFFFFNDTATTEIYTLSLHDALPISVLVDRHFGRRDHPGLALGPGVELLHELHDVHPMGPERRAHRRWPRRLFRPGPPLLQRGQSALPPVSAASNSK